MWLPLRGSRCWSCCPLSALNLPPQDSESCPSSSSTATKNTEQRHQRQLWPPPPTSSKEGWIGSRTQSAKPGGKKKSSCRISFWSEVWESKRQEGEKWIGWRCSKKIVWNVKFVSAPAVWCEHNHCFSGLCNGCDSPLKDTQTRC